MSHDGVIGKIEEQEWLKSTEEGLQTIIHQAFQLKGGRQVKNLLHGTWLGLPLHVILTDIPIGAWTAALVFDGLDSINTRLPYGRWGGYPWARWRGWSSGGRTNRLARHRPACSSNWTRARLAQRNRSPRREPGANREKTCPFFAGANGLNWDCQVVHISFCCNKTQKIHTFFDILTAWAPATARTTRSGQHRQAVCVSKAFVGLSSNGIVPSGSRNGIIFRTCRFCSAAITPAMPTVRF